MTLQVGDRGSDVQRVQQMLAALGFEIDIDGIFGSETEGVVRRFETEAGIGVDGIVGPDTLRALEQEVERSATGTRKKRTVTFPSGAVFHEVANPSGDIDYSDHVGAGVVPLIEVRGRENERLSEHFTVREFMCRDGAPYARISPELIGNLQRLRERISQSILVSSGYRHKRHNEAEKGATDSQHIAGRAADVRSTTLKPIDLAAEALAVFGCNIGIGLGKNIVHLDLRGSRASWVYKDTPMTDSAFEKWVKEQCGVR